MELTCETLTYTPIKAFCSSLHLTFKLEQIFETYGSKEKPEQQWIEKKQRLI